VKADGEVIQQGLLTSSESDPSVSLNEPPTLNHQTQ